MIRIDALWLCTKAVDMRYGAERLLAHVVHALGSTNAHHGYMFANARATRIKMLVHDGFGVWCAARRLNAGRFAWPREIDTAKLWRVNLEETRATIRMRTVSRSLDDA